MNKYIPEKIKQFAAYTANTKPCNVMLDANESPFLPSSQMMDAFRQGLAGASLNRYPDPLAKELVAAFSSVYQVPAECVVASNGSDEIIGVIVSSFLSAGDTMLVAAPDFSMYAFYGALYGIQVTEYTTDADFNLDFTALAERVIKSGAKLVIFSNPCNPTGRLYDDAKLKDFVRQTDALIVVDEAYGDFAAVDATLLPLVEQQQNLIVLKTLSKAFGLAGARLGFAVSNKQITQALYKVKSPYNVNVLSQQLGKLLLNDSANMRSRVSYILAERERVWPILQEKLSPYGVRVYETQANFILMDFGNQAKAVYEALLEKGTRIRFMPPHLRVTIGLREENDAFIAQVCSVLADTQGERV